MITYVRKAPTVVQLDGHFLVTFDSGTTTLQLLLTRNACFALGRNAMNESCSAFESDAAIIQFEASNPRKGGNV